jgi:alpha-glucosidase
MMMTTNLKMIKMRATLVLALSTLFTAASAQEWNFDSPDKKLNVRILNQQKLSYAVTYNGKVVINDSPLGIQLDDQQFTEGLKFRDRKQTNIKETYRLLVGKRLDANNAANELTLEFENVNKKKIQVIFRAYNDGIAFRYHFADSDGSLHKVMLESSGFAIPKEAKAWIQPYDLNVRMKPCYETYYEDGIAPGSPSPNPAGWAFPVLYTVNNAWILLSEAGLDETYCAAHLEDKDSSGVYTIRFPEREEVTSDADPQPVSTLPWTTPWRLAIVGASPDALYQSTLVTDLNPPSKIKDTSWIKPGRASWSWWSKGSTTKEFNVQKEYVDFNAAMGWEYVLIDAGWPQMEGGKMEDLIAYATSKGVGIFLWYHSGMGREKDTISMSNLMAFPESRRTEMARIQRWGVKGIKVDFFDSDKQPVIKRYYDIMRDAAHHKLMVNFHGSTLPRGWERTYPHLVSMESVKGAEGYGRQQFCDRAPVHNTILPFTRNVVGSMDYTPVTFTNKREAIRQTTFGHELALSIVFESGVSHFADQMNSYKALPDSPRKFLMNVPVVWDETRYLAGIPGKYVVLARRKGNQWYIGGINGQAIEQEAVFNLPLTNKKTSLEVITDGDQPGTFTTRSISTNGKNIKMKIAPKGGFVAIVR